MTGNVFLGVSLSDAERHGLAAALTDTDLSRIIPGKRTRPGNWHITVRFIGPASELQIDRLAERVESLLECEGGRVWVTGLGAFPKFSKASVLYAAVDDPTGILDELAITAEEAATDVGFEPEGRPYIPHLTLSRVRPVRDVSPISAALDDVRVPVTVGTLTMFQTVQTRDGPEYQALHDFRLS
jgi:2'-5' RNA ligase